MVQRQIICFELNNIAVWFPNWGTRCGGFKVEVKLNAYLVFYYSYICIYKQIWNSSFSDTLCWRTIGFVLFILMNIMMNHGISNVYTNIKKRCILFRNRDNQLDVYENIACPHTCYLWNHLNLNWTISTTISMCITHGAIVAQSYKCIL